MNCLFDCIRSSVDEKAILRQMNADIEAELKRDKKKSRQEVKLLLLGTGQSGKSTFVKQMRIIHGNSYNERERCSFIPYIHSNTLLAANTLIDAMKKLAISFEDDDNRKNSELISAQDTSVCIWLSEQVVRAINCLWKDDNVQYVYSRRAEYDLLDSAKYFLDSLDRIFSPDYIPSDQDILRVRIPTTGVQESFFKLQSMTFRIVDVGGQRSERKKWIHCFDSVTSIIFLASLCEYDQLLDADSESNSGSSMSSTSTRSSKDRNTKMEVSLALFSTIVSYPGFSRTSFILFLNKKDLFEQKIVNSHLATYYPEYTGPKFDAPSAGKFIQDLYLTRSRKSARMISYPNNKYKQVPSVGEIENSPPLHQRWRQFRHQPLKQVNASDTNNRCAQQPSNLNTRYSHADGKNIYTHFTAATDTENMRLVFSSVKDTILRRNIEDYLF